MQHLHGSGVLTFHLPFIIASTALGGPVAGGWVAMLATLEARELREVPWYGTLANHSAMALSAVLGGVILGFVTDGSLGVVTGNLQPAEVAAIVFATLVISGLSAGLAAGTVILRDGLSPREAARLLDGSYRTTSASEIVLGWVLALVYGTIGWWAALVCATLVLVVWQAHDAREIARHDAMTGLLSRPGFDARLEETLRAIRRGAGQAALLAIDLDGFKAVNDAHGHAAGDEVIREIGARLQRSVRLTDAAVRRGGDEFGVLLAGISDPGAARLLAQMILDELRKPIDANGRSVTVGASIGVIMIDGAGPEPSIDRLHALADHEMYLAKDAGGGVRVRDTEDVVAPGPAVSEIA
ncbi:MAG: GGDEF domain-containing protein [Chloroflexi bacterium]|nr:GGDEF domain-containing protein [Chloroflexota bacterium]